METAARFVPSPVGVSGEFKGKSEVRKGRIWSEMPPSTEKGIETGANTGKVSVMDLRRETCAQHCVAYLSTKAG